MKYLLALLILLNAADGVVTHYLLKFGLATEGNPFLLGVVGQPLFLVLKVAGILLCVMLLWDIHRRHRRLALWSTAAFVTSYLFIVLWNASLFLAQ